MNSTALWWLLLNLITLAIMSFYSMMEMACVSFNKVRLHYYVSKKSQRALWLNYLMQNPTRLFGTTLIGVNVTMMIGSECSRLFYSSLGYSPDIAPLTQILIVITIGELAPMFAARRFPEHVAMLGMPILYVSARLMTPILWLINGLTYLITYFLGKGGTEQGNIFLSRDELQKMIEEQEEVSTIAGDSEEFNIVVSNIFNLRAKTAVEVMLPLDPKAMVSSTATLAHLSQMLRAYPLPFVPVYHRQHSNIIGIVFPRDLIRVSDNHLVRDHSLQPWFITESSKIMEILSQFRRNSQTVAVVLNTRGRAVGMLTLDSMLDEIFGKAAGSAYGSHFPHLHARRVIERTLQGDMLIGDFSAEFGVELEAEDSDTLSKFIADNLSHPPEVGDTLQLDEIKLTVKETSLLGVKTVTLMTRTAGKGASLS